MTFHIGQKIACVNDQSWYSPEIDIIPTGYLPVFGNVYTITNMETWGRSFALSIQELPADAIYDSDGFRPIVETETDISVFKKMLIPNRSKELVE